MRQTLTALILSVAAITTAQAQSATDQACMLESQLKVGSQTIDIKDCIHFTQAQARAQMKSTCESLGEMIMSNGKGKITYLPQCPKPAQGICRQPPNAPILGGADSYYYKRSAQELQSMLPKSCTAAGGKWMSGQ